MLTSKRASEGLTWTSFSGEPAKRVMASSMELPMLLPMSLEARGASLQMLAMVADAALCSGALCSPAEAQSTERTSASCRKWVQA